MRFSYFSSPHASGFGTGRGARREFARPEATVIATGGDGANFFGESLTCVFVQRAHQPVTTLGVAHSRAATLRS